MISEAQELLRDDRDLPASRLFSVQPEVSACNSRVLQTSSIMCFALKFGSVPTDRSQMEADIGA